VTAVRDDRADRLPYECDAFGHLNQAALLTLLERARWDALARGPGIDLFERNGVWPAVRKATIGVPRAGVRARRAARETTVAGRGTTSMTCVTWCGGSRTMLRWRRPRWSSCASIDGRATPVPEEIAAFSDPGRRRPQPIRVPAGDIELAVDVARRRRAGVVRACFPFDRHDVAATSSPCCAGAAHRADFRGVGDSGVPRTPGVRTPGPWSPRSSAYRVRVPVRPGAGTPESPTPRKSGAMRRTRDSMRAGAATSAIETGSHARTTPARPSPRHVHASSDVARRHSDRLMASRRRGPRSGRSLSGNRRGAPNRSMHTEDHLGLRHRSIVRDPAAPRDAGSCWVVPRPATVGLHAQHVRARTPARGTQIVALRTAGHTPFRSNKSIPGTAGERIPACALEQREQRRLVQVTEPRRIRMGKRSARFVRTASRCGLRLRNGSCKTYARKHALHVARCTTMRRRTLWRRTSDRG